MTTRRSTGNAFFSNGRSEVQIPACQIGHSLPTAHHRCNISLKGDVLPWRNDTGIGRANSLHASAYYNEYNKRFDLIKMATVKQVLWQTLLFTILPVLH